MQLVSAVMLGSNVRNAQHTQERKLVSHAPFRAEQTRQR